MVGYKTLGCSVLTIRCASARTERFRPDVPTFLATFKNKVRNIKETVYVTLENIFYNNNNMNQWKNITCTHVADSSKKIMPKHQILLHVQKVRTRKSNQNETH